MKFPEKLAKTFDGFYKAKLHRFYIDEVYLFITKKIIFNNIARPIAWFDRHVIDGTMNGIASSTQWVAVKIKRFQSVKFNICLCFLWEHYLLPHW